jgi:hypothetical protein
MLTYVCWRMLTYADVCWRMLTYDDVRWHMVTYDDIWWRMLTYADVCWRMLTYDDVCWRLLTYAEICWVMLRYADVCWCMLRYDDVCWRMPTYADVCICSTHVHTPVLEMRYSGEDPLVSEPLTPPFGRPLRPPERGQYLYFCFVPVKQVNWVPAVPRKVAARVYQYSMRTHAVVWRHI